MENDFEYPALVVHGIKSEDFDANGYRWPEKHLKIVFPVVAFWPLPIAAQFVDRLVFEIVTKNNADEISLLSRLLEFEKGDPRQFIDTCTFGNLAFTAWYCKDSELAQKAEKKFEELSGELSKMIIGKFPTAECIGMEISKTFTSPLILSNN